MLYFIDFDMFQPPNYSQVISRSSTRTLSETSATEHDWPGLVADSKCRRQQSGSRSLSISSVTSVLSSQPDSDTHYSELVDIPAEEDTAGQPAPLFNAAANIKESAPDTADIPDAANKKYAAESHNVPSDLVDQLVEMFPDACTTDITRSLAQNCNNIEAAVLSLLGDSPGTMITSNHESAKDSNATVKLTFKQARQRKRNKSRKKSSSQSCDETAETEPSLDLSPSSGIKSLIVDK